MKVTEIENLLGSSIDIMTMRSSRETTTEAESRIQQRSRRSHHFVRTVHVGWLTATALSLATLFQHEALLGMSYQKFEEQEVYLSSPWVGSQAPERRPPETATNKLSLLLPNDF
jgi:hypothetical protein